jgi:hypothetical protein
MALMVYLLKYLVDIRKGSVYSSVTVWNITKRRNRPFCDVCTVPA